MTEQLEWHALYEDDEPWMAYVLGHQDLFALAPIAEAEIRKTFPCHEETIASHLDEAGGAALAHMWLREVEMTADGPLYNIANHNDAGAFAITGVRFWL